jgi:hypothetical protein
MPSCQGTSSHHIHEPGGASGVSGEMAIGSSAALGPPAPLGSSAPPVGPPVAPAPPSVLLPVTCPTTRAQHGIHKPKIQTDGTIRYGFLTESSEPNNLRKLLAIQIGNLLWIVSIWHCLRIILGT